MAGLEDSDGVFRTARSTDLLETLCTTIYDLNDRKLMICGHHGKPEYRGVSELLDGANRF